MHIPEAKRTKQAGIRREPAPTPLKNTQEKTRHALQRAGFEVV